jgi:myo-inositol-1(or 4)-monophosphatase
MPAHEVPAALLDELQEVALRVATGAAELLQPYSDVRLEHVNTKSSPTDLVSEADRASEAYIVSELHRSRPGDALLSEEGASHDGTTKVFWVADPLDGTTNFFYQVPAYSVSLAACYEGDPVVGVVVDPSRHETWSAAQGRGAWCNDVPCHLLPRIRDIRRIGSAALDLCWVANGRFDAYFESGLHYWDWAAGSVVCQEAGGVIATLPGDIVLASTPQLLTPLTKLLADAQTEAQAVGLS